MLTTQPYHQQFVWNNTLMFLNVKHLRQFSVRTTPELKPFKIAIDKLINTEKEDLKHLQLFLNTLIHHNVLTTPKPPTSIDVPSESNRKSRSFAFTRKIIQTVISDKLIR